MQTPSDDPPEIPTFLVKFRISLHCGASSQREFWRCRFSDFLSEENLSITTAGWTPGASKIAENPSKY